MLGNRRQALLLPGGRGANATEGPRGSKHSSAPSAGRGPRRMRSVPPRPASCCPQAWPPRPTPAALTGVRGAAGVTGVTGPGLAEPGSGEGQDAAGEKGDAWRGLLGGGRLTSRVETVLVNRSSPSSSSSKSVGFTSPSGGGSLSAAIFPGLGLLFSTVAFETTVVT